MANQLLDMYWESLGENSVFLCMILVNQEKCLQQLQQQNQYLQTQLMTTQNGVINTASATAVTMAQNLVIPALVTGMASTQSIKPAEPNKLVVIDHEPMNLFVQLNF